MSGRRNGLVMMGLVLSVSLIAAAVSVMVVCRHYGRVQFDLLNAVCGEVAKQDPESTAIIAAALKEFTGGNNAGTQESDILSLLGYRSSDFSDLTYKQTALFSAAGFLTGIFLFLVTFFYRNQTEVMRIRALAEYLEQVNLGKAMILSASGEDDFSKLEDEIYKTVTSLYQTRDKAVRAKDEYAENLSNIAHQIKTPLTAVSLSVQMMRQECHLEQGSDCFKRYSYHLEQVERQILRLTRLEEALLVLSRIDAGTILLERVETDVFTLLVLAADHLRQLFDRSGAFADIPELGEMPVMADPDWTMEAIMNLMKNCMEHSGGGVVRCSYAQNPLYTEILIWDEGDGFAKEDIPHLFERFYRGRNPGEGGIGIGLALSKEIIERQNGTIRARNKTGGGALFEIRFYQSG